MLVTRQEAAQLLGVSVSALRKWMDDPTTGLSAHVRLGASAEQMRTGRVTGCLAQVPLEAIARVMLLAYRTDGYDRSEPKEPSAESVRSKALELIQEVYVMRRVAETVNRRLAKTAAGAARAIKRAEQPERAA